MTIGKGTAWGEPAPLPGELAVAADDAGLAAAAWAAHGRGERLEATVGPGDVLRTLGLDGPRARGDQLRYSFDLGLARLDGGPPRPFVAHLCARRRLWRGPFAVVMNGAWLGSWYLGPRAHPNDGLLDITWGALPPGQRLLARRRVTTGSHLPHPGLDSGRVARWEHTFDRPVAVLLDGRRQARCRHLAVEVVPDCFWLHA